MATELSSWTFPERRGWKYDWASWMNGSAWELRRGTEEERVAGKADFSTSVRAFQQSAYGYAHRRRGRGIIRVETDILDEDTIVIRAVLGAGTAERRAVRWHALPGDEIPAGIGQVQRAVLAVLRDDRARRWPSGGLAEALGIPRGAVRQAATALERRGLIGRER